MMQSIVWTGRILSRALYNGIANYSNNTEPNLSVKKKSRLVSAVCGLPKDIANSKFKKGQFGDDAWFSTKYKSFEALGLADGVGGWRRYGIDPGEFSAFLMRTCQRLVETGRFQPNEPALLLGNSYYELLQSKRAILGSSTACVIILNGENNTVYTANIGDSGFLVLRHGEVIHRSEEQQHYFNTPFQLSLAPPGQSQFVLADRPESANTTDFPVEDGDVILMATDGVFDNVPDQLLIPALCTIQGERDPGIIQSVANSICLMARSLALDAEFISPFAQRARENGIDAIGGKPDDITVLLATVAI